MATLTSAGVGSGLNVESIVSQLVAAERQPADARLSALESTTKAQISAFGSITSAMSSLGTALDKLKGDGSLPGRKATVAADAGFSASASSKAALGSYSITVEALAAAQKLQSAAVASSTQVGNGTLTFQVGADAAFDVVIQAGKGTLADIRDAINSQASGKGVTATIVHGDSGDVLTLTSDKTGSAGVLSISASGGDGGLSVLGTSGGTLTQVVAARDAVVTVDGITRTASSNRLTDVIDGVTLDLAKAKPGEAFSLSVGADPSSLKTTLQGFITAYNAALGTMRTQSAAGGEGATAGALSGDATPRAIMASMRNTISNSYADFAALGLKTGVDGSLSLDGAKFDTAIAANPNAVKNLFGDDADFGKNMRGLLQNYIGDAGLLASRSKSLTEQMKSVTEQRSALDARMERVGAAYRARFTALDSMMAQLQGTSSYIAQQLGKTTSG